MQNESSNGNQTDTRLSASIEKLGEELKSQNLAKCMTNSSKNRNG